MTLDEEGGIAGISIKGNNNADRLGNPPKIDLISYLKSRPFNSFKFRVNSNKKDGGGNSNKKDGDGDSKKDSPDPSQK